MPDRSTARSVGVLFVVATAAAIVGGLLLLPLEEPTYLADVAGHEGRMVSGALIELIMVLAVIGIAVLMFPVLKRQSEGLALGYVGARIVEGVLLLAASVSALFVLSLSRGQAGAAAAQPLGDLVLTVREWTYLLGSLVMLGLGALIFYTLLYRSKLVPVWLAVWGLVGAALVLLRGLLEVYGVESSGLVQGLYAAPIAINEMVLAAWLIVRGFAGPTAASETEEVMTAGRER